MLRPADHVGTRGVAPIHVLPGPAGGIALPEQVILAVVVHHAVGIVVPAPRLTEVKLRPQRLVIKRLQVLELVARRDQPADRVRGGGPDPGRLALELRDVEPGPPVDTRLVHREVALQTVDQLIAHDHGHPPPLGLVVGHREDQIAASELDFDWVFKSGQGRVADRGGRRLLARRVALCDLIHVHVAPAIARGVHEPEHGLRSPVVADVPCPPSEQLAQSSLRCRPRRREHRSPIHEELHAGLAGVAAAADQESDVVALDLEGGRGERSRGAISTAEGVHEALPLEPAYLHLVCKRAPCRTRAERLAFHSPIAIGRALEVGDQDIVGSAGAADDGEQHGDGE